MLAVINPLGGVTQSSYDSSGRETASYSGQLADTGADGYAAATTGTWTSAGNDAMGGQYEVAATTSDPSPTATATWTFGGLAPGGEYKNLRQLDSGQRQRHGRALHRLLQVHGFQRSPSGS